MKIFSRDWLVLLSLITTKPLAVATMPDASVMRLSVILQIGVPLPATGEVFSAAAGVGVGAAYAEVASAQIRHTAAPTTVDQRRIAQVWQSRAPDGGTRIAHHAS